ncbi:MAG TPA: family 1 glycosylhydrolase [Spirochaetota bacterium]|nr:family 1 glycosylhydrolase [Spirochaetota bacterium]
MSIKLPQTFILGSSISAYQTEGANLIDGKKESIWDAFNGSGFTDSLKNGADFYNRFTSDIKTMQKLGISNFRFSIAWSRILPDGTGSLNKKGITFYNRLIDTLLEHNIKPSVTLYSHDLPVRLQKNGGFLNRETCTAFADYTEICANHFGDRIKNWITIEDPLTEIEYGYRTGTMPPGVIAPEKIFVATHNMLIAHAMAYYTLKEANSDNYCGLGVRMDPPLITPTKRDSRIHPNAEAYLVKLLIDPVIKGYYPAVYESEIYSQNRLNLRPKDTMLIHNSYDYIALAHSGYTHVKSKIVNVNINDPLSFSITQYPALENRYSKTIGYDPSAIQGILKTLQTEYGNPKILFANVGYPSDNHDAQNRINFYHAILSAIADAIANGGKIEGFFTKSFIDGFELINPTRQRSGLVKVNFTTFEREVTDTARWFSKVCKNNEL